MCIANGVQNLDNETDRINYTYTLLCINFVHLFYLVYWPIRPWFVWQRRGIPVQQPCPDAPLEGETKTKIKRVIIIITASIHKLYIQGKVPG